MSWDLSLIDPKIIFTFIDPEINYAIEIYGNQKLITECINKLKEYGNVKLDESKESLLFKTYYNVDNIHTEEKRHEVLVSIKKIFKNHGLKFAYRIPKLKQNKI